MALSQVTVLAQIRALCESATGVKRAFGAGNNDEDAIPAAIFEAPAMVVLPGPTIEYILTTGGQRHTYEVKVLVFCREGSDLGQSAYSALPLVDAIISTFVGNVTLGNRANSAHFDRSSGFATLEYSGQEYLGYEVTLRVSEQGTASPSIGS